MVHSRTKRRALAISAVSVASMVLAGCTPTSGSGSAGDLSGEIRILANITPQLTQDYYENLVAPYVAAHPGVTVTIEVPSGDSVQSTLQQELASGDTPDIVASNLDPVVIPQLTAFPDEDWVNETPLVDDLKVDGVVWQVQSGTSVQSLVFYNKDAFAEAGIAEPPTTLDEFTADLELLKAAGYLPLQTAGEWVTGAQFTMIGNPALLGDDADWFVQRNEKEVTFADSAYATYLDAYEGWVKDGLVSPDSLGVKYDDSITGFTSGTAATYLMGNWIVPAIEEAETSFEVGVFPTPTLDGSVAKQLSGGAQPYSILKASENQALAMDLVKYLVTDEAAVTESLASEGNFRKGFSYEAGPVNAAVAAIVDASPGGVEGVGGLDVPTGFGEELNKQVQNLYIGVTAKDALSALDSWWDENAVQ